MVKSCNHPECEFAHQNKRNGQLNRLDINTHGLSHTKEYEVWNSIKQRCYNPTNISYEYYGGKGITVFR